MEEKILKHRLSSGGVILPNQRCRQRNSHLQGLNEDNDLARTLAGSFKSRGRGKS